MIRPLRVLVARLRCDGPGTPASLVGCSGRGPAARRVLTGCETSIDGGADDTAAGDAGGLRDLDGEPPGRGGGRAADGVARARIAALQRRHRPSSARRPAPAGSAARTTSPATSPSSPAAAGPATPPTSWTTTARDLFGVDSATLQLEEPDTETVPHVITTTAHPGARRGPRPRRLAGLHRPRQPPRAPTTSGSPASAAGSSPGSSSAPPRPCPRAGRGHRRRRPSGGTAEGTPRLVVLPTGTGVLAWEVVVVASDAGRTAPRRPATTTSTPSTGDVVDVRPAGAERRRRRSVARLGGGRAGPQQRRGDRDRPARQELTAHGLQTGERVELTDTTTAAWDPADPRRAAIQTYDATGVHRTTTSCRASSSVSPTTTITRPRGHRRTGLQPRHHRLLREPRTRLLGRRRAARWSARCNFGADGFCNAFFAGSCDPPQMVYGDPCVLDGAQLTGTLRRARHRGPRGHPRRHRDHRRAALHRPVGRAQRELLRLLRQRDRQPDPRQRQRRLGEDACAGHRRRAGSCAAPTRTAPCRSATCSTATTSTTTCGILDPGQRLHMLLNYKQDNGGVHYNSAIWNNALWSIRTQLAKIDGQPGQRLAVGAGVRPGGVRRPRHPARPDQRLRRRAGRGGAGDHRLPARPGGAAHRARGLRRRARSAPAARPPASWPATRVSTAPQTQLHPSISGDRSLWLDLSSGSD